MNRKIISMLIVLLMVAVSVFGCDDGGKKTVTIGAKNFTEQYILGNMISVLLEENGYNADEKFGTGSTVTRKALLSEQIDLYPEYTGTGWTVYLKNEEKINDPQKLYEKVKEQDMKENEIEWIGRSKLNNTYALAVKKENADKYGKTLSELSENLKKMDEKPVFAVEHEFYERPDGFWKMAEEYNMDIDKSQVKTMDMGLTFEAMEKNQVDIAMVFSTDGKLKKYDLSVFDDDKNFFPVYNISITTRKEYLEKNPELKELLLKIVNVLNSEEMRELNYLVDAEGKDERTIAKNYLKEKGLIK